MNKFTLSVVAALTLAVGSANAFVMGNSEKCSGDSEVYTSKIDYKVINSVDKSLNEAAGAINSMDQEPAAFIVDVTAGTAVRVGQTATSVAQDGAEYIHKLVRFALQTPQCAGDANNLPDGVDCFIQLPNKVITLSLVSATDLAGDVVAGVYSVGDGLVGAAQDLSIAISNGLKNSGTGFVGEALSVPFVIVGVVLEGVRIVGRVLVVDTIGGALKNAGGLFVTLGTDVCDILRSLVHLRIDRALYHSVGLVVNGVAEGLNLVIGILTLGNVSIKEDFKKNKKNPQERTEWPEYNNATD